MPSIRNRLKPGSAENYWNSACKPHQEKASSGGLAFRIDENLINEQPSLTAFGLVPVGNDAKAFGVNANVAGLHFLDLCR